MNALSCDGLLVLDKPGGVTSRDVVDLAQRWFPRGTRIGHTGTLDPMATGVLLLVVGKATRLTKFESAGDKSYDAVVRFGFTTDTADAQGRPVGPREPCGIAHGIVVVHERGAMSTQPSCLCPGPGGQVEHGIRITGLEGLVGELR